MTASVRGPKVEGGQQHGRNTVITVVPAELRVVNYNDGNGKNETRLMLVIPVEDGDPAMFFFPKGFDPSMQVPSTWIKKQVLERLNGNDAVVPAEDEPTGLQTMAASLPKPSAVNVMKTGKS